MIRTKKGRVVYDRKPHFYIMNDVFRIMAKIEDETVMGYEDRIPVWMGSYMKFSIHFFNLLIKAELKDATKNIVGDWAVPIVLKIIEMLQAFGEFFWGKLYSAVEGFFRPSKK